MQNEDQRKAKCDTRSQHITLMEGLEKGCLVKSARGLSSDVASQLHCLDAKTLGIKKCDLCLGDQLIHRLVRAGPVSRIALSEQGQYNRQSRV